MVPRRARVETAPTVLLEAAKEPADPSGLIEPADAPPERSTMMFVLILIAISLASLAVGVFLANPSR